MSRCLKWMATASVVVWLTAGCGGETKGDPKAEAPPQTKVEHEEDVNVVQTDHPEQLKVLGGNIDHPAAVVNIVAPISGVITDQQITNAAGVQGLSSPNPFTISDLSTVWIICDVYENDLPNVHVGETADIRLNAYP